MNFIVNLLLVFLGSGIGGACRWIVAVLTPGSYPFGTLVVNVVGCFLVGAFSRNAPLDPHLRLMLVAGFCGGFTTYSTFINESFLLLNKGQMLIAIGYMALSLALGMFAAWAGYQIK